MGRLLKMKRLIVEEANKKLLNESMVDIDNVLGLMKYKFAWGDLSPERVEEFDTWLGVVKNEMNDEEYANLFNDWLRSEADGLNLEI